MDLDEIDQWSEAIRLEANCEIEYSRSRVETGLPVDLDRFGLLWALALAMVFTQSLTSQLRREREGKEEWNGR